jgi:Cu2+-exporting ATPase
VKPLVLALEDGSSHPLADGFRRAWSGLPTATVSASRHVAGGGLEGTVDGHTVRIGSPRFVRESTMSIDESMERVINTLDRTLTPVYVAIDGVLVAIAALGDRVRDDALESLQQLRGRGWRTVMLSGDAQDVVASVGRALAFEAQDAIGGVSPEGKLAFVEQLKATTGRTVVMVGDGVNDAAAIAAAHVGVGVHGGAEACLATADIYLTRPGLGALVELTEGSRRTLQVIRRNIALSIGYNLIGASLAVFGLLTPLIAAILMPTSSITVVLGSWYSTTFARSTTTESVS